MAAAVRRRVAVSGGAPRRVPRVPARARHRRHRRVRLERQWSQALPCHALRPLRRLLPTERVPAGARRRKCFPRTYPIGCGQLKDRLCAVATPDSVMCSTSRQGSGRSAEGDRMDTTVQAATAARGRSAHFGRGIRPSAMAASSLSACRSMLANPEMPKAAAATCACAEAAVSRHAFDSSI